MVAKDTQIVEPAATWKLPAMSLLLHWKNVYPGALNDHVIRAILRDRVLFPFKESWVIPEIEGHHLQSSRTY